MTCIFCSLWIIWHAATERFRMRESINQAPLTQRVLLHLTALCRSHAHTQPRKEPCDLTHYITPSPQARPVLWVSMVTGLQGPVDQIQGDSQMCQDSALLGSSTTANLQPTYTLGDCCHGDGPLGPYCAGAAPSALPEMPVTSVLLAAGCSRWASKPF